MSQYNPSIAKIIMPASIKALPVDPVRGYPVPWFVAWVEGKPEFRVADGKKIAQAIVERRCWVCGEMLNNRVTFPIGPMCTINRISGEPPSHPDCAIYSVQACPFLSRPHMNRREEEIAGTKVVGLMITRNPGVTCLWTTKSPGYHVLREKNGILFEIVPPTTISWWAEGRLATPAEVSESVRTGLPHLEKIANEDGPNAVAHLNQLIADAAKYFPVGTEL